MFSGEKIINMGFLGLRSRASIFQPPGIAEVQSIDDASSAATNKLSFALFFENK